MSYILHWTGNQPKVLKNISINVIGPLVVVSSRMSVEMRSGVNPFSLRVCHQDRVLIMSLTVCRDVPSSYVFRSSVNMATRKTQTDVTLANAVIHAWYVTFLFLVCLLLLL